MATVDDIFAKINTHMVEGMMLHDQMADYYDFIGLMGFKRMHEYRFLHEVAEMRGLHRYFINHYNKLLAKADATNPKAIPSAWLMVSRKEVDSSAKKMAVDTAIKAWCDWEIKTKEMYQQAYKDLCEIGEIAAADKVKSFITDVDMELKYADRLHIKLVSIGYDMPTIVLMQDEIHEEYAEKEKEICVSIC